MRRRIEKLKPYPFASDFRKPEPSRSTPEQLNLTSADLAQLLEETRQSTAALVRDETLCVESEKLADASQNLRQALSLIVDLAAHLETAALDETDRQSALNKVQRLANALIEGQRDLFDT